MGVEFVGFAVETFGTLSDLRTSETTRERMDSTCAKCHYKPVAVDDHLSGAKHRVDDEETKVELAVVAGLRLGPALGLALAAAVVKATDVDVVGVDGAGGAVGAGEESAEDVECSVVAVVVTLSSFGVQSNDSVSDFEDVVNRVLEDVELMKTTHVVRYAACCPSGQSPGLS